MLALQSRRARGGHHLSEISSKIRFSWFAFQPSVSELWRCISAFHEENFFQLTFGLLQLSLWGRRLALAILFAGQTPGAAPKSVRFHGRGGMGAVEKLSISPPDKKSKDADPPSSRRGSTSSRKKKKKSSSAPASSEMVPMATLEEEPRFHFDYFMPAMCEPPRAHAPIVPAPPSLDTPRECRGNACPLPLARARCERRARARSLPDPW